MSSTEQISLFDEQDSTSDKAAPKARTERTVAKTPKRKKSASAEQAPAVAEAATGQEVPDTQDTGSGNATPPPEKTPPARSDAPNDGPLRRLMDDNFLQYASYVIRDRAIPDLQDGLKPVQRRILYSLHENDDGKFIKVANIVGHTMKYHPHGDASIGDALVVLTNKGFLIEPQGNFGNIFTGDPAAAPRYIECRLTPLAREEIFNDELTTFIPSYDSRGKEPVNLPAKLPLLLMQGAEGIAVGLSTRILPHNFAELIEAQIAILNKKPFKLYPDFIQGGQMDVKEYDKGNGRVRVRAKIEKRDEHTLIIREIPFGTTTDSVISSIENAARKQKIKVKSIDDYTAEIIEIQVHLGAGQKPDRAIQALYAFTQCEAAISSRVVVIDGKKPVELDVDEVLRRNTARMVEILKQELLNRLQQLQDEIHRLTLVQIFVENRVYKDIESCKTYAKVKQAVEDGINRFRKQLVRDLTAQDVDMLLAIPIKRISRFDLEKSKQDIDNRVKEQAEVEKHLKAMKAYAIRYLKKLLKTYGGAHPRRTKIKSFEQVEVRELAAREIVIGHDRENGYLGFEVKSETSFKCSTLDRIVIVWTDGRYKVIPPPDRLFVDQDVQYVAVAERDRVMTVVYKHDKLNYLKRFTFGGAIMNKEYLCTLEDSEILFLADDDPSELYVKYRPAKNQRIHQQIFNPQDCPLKGVKARGQQMTSKRIKSISCQKPRQWDEKAGPKGAFLNL